VDRRGRREGDHGLRSRAEQVAHDLISGLGGASDSFENAAAGSLPSATADVKADLCAAVAGAAGLLHAEDPVGDGTFGIGLEHPSTMTAARTRMDACG
jgi:hypothetical protein